MRIFIHLFSNSSVGTSVRAVDLSHLLVVLPFIVITVMLLMCCCCCVLYVTIRSIYPSIHPSVYLCVSMSLLSTYACVCILYIYCVFLICSPFLFFPSLQPPPVPLFQLRFLFSLPIFILLAFSSIHPSFFLSILQQDLSLYFVDFFIEPCDSHIFLQKVTFETPMYSIFPSQYLFVILTLVLLLLFTYLVFSYKSQTKYPPGRNWNWEHINGAHSEQIREGK